MRKQLTKTDILEALELILLENNPKTTNGFLWALIQLFITIVMISALIPIAYIGWIM